MLLGYKSVGHLNREMDCLEFDRWAELDQEEPLGDRGKWLRHAQMMHLTYELNTTDKAPPKTVADFLPDFLS